MEFTHKFSKPISLISLGSFGEDLIKDQSISSLSNQSVNPHTSSLVNVLIQNNASLGEN